MSNEEFIYHPFVKSRVSETLGRTFLVYFSDIFYNAPLESNYLPLGFLKNSLLIPFDSIF